ncbi:glycosyltransferase family 2 protein [Verrucomicrobiaceae bacterium N1E253]|uniref:Glycosyltransferase family 2 protein n=2 Tax=Oceaniferula marina TaxID=2748318 RepID=A0A851GS60_9BACT|nr:glycosyltransferase family 2 protein [Oceaniferula marina]
MPCYQAGNSVGRAINSIRTQTFKDWELIVVDDGSSDHSIDEILNHVRQDQRVCLIRQPHQGVVAASNHGFEHARGATIARMDADDVSRPRRLECQLEYLHAHRDLGAVSCQVHFAGDSSLAGGYAHHVHWTNSCRDAASIERNRFIDLPVPHPTLLYRREIIEQHGHYRHGDFPEDYELILRWISQGVSIGKTEDILFDWYDPPSRLSRNDTRYHMSAFHQCKAPYLLKALQKNGTDTRDLWIWGAGRPSRKSARPLEHVWKQASGFIDIDPAKIGRQLHGRPVVSPNDLPPPEQAVIVSYVGTRGAHQNIRECLLSAGRREGIDFWIAA